MESKSGWQILRACAGAGEEWAWRAFVDRFEPALRRGIRRAIYRLGFDGDRRDLSADLLQECYCKILARECRALKLCREQNEAALDAYFVRLGDRCARDSLRARWSQKRGSRDGVVDVAGSVVDALAPGSEPSPEESLLIHEARARLLEACLRAAGARKRERNARVLVMAFLEGLSSREIASRFPGELSRTCIDSVVYRARKRLREQGVSLAERRAVA